MPDNGRYTGTVSFPSDLDSADEREQRERTALAGIDARLAGGQVTPEEADREILDLALARLSYLPTAAIDELRQLGLELLEEPEMVETRELAPRAGVDFGRKR